VNLPRFTDTVAGYDPLSRISKFHLHLPASTCEDFPGGFNLFRAVSFLTAIEWFEVINYWCRRSYRVGTAEKIPLEFTQEVETP